MPPDLLDPATIVAGLGLPPLRRPAQRMPGHDALVWRAELADGRTVALRVLRPHKSADRELAALRLASEHRHRVPAVVTTNRWQDREVIVLSWCRGRTVADLLSDGAAPHDLGVIFGQAHARLHAPIDASGGALCHLDFQPRNVLVDGAEVSCIVDWANARVGDPRADIAWTRVVLALAPVLRPDFAPHADSLTDAWQEGYRTVRPMAADTELAPFLAAAAQRRLDDWVPRAAAGECSGDVVRRAAEILDHYRRP